MRRRKETGREVVNEAPLAKEHGQADQGVKSNEPTEEPAPFLQPRLHGWSHGGIIRRWPEMSLRN